MASYFCCCPVPTHAIYSLTGLLQAVFQPAPLSVWARWSVVCSEQSFCSHSRLSNPPFEKTESPELSRWAAMSSRAATVQLGWSEVSLCVSFQHQQHIRSVVTVAVTGLTVSLFQTFIQKSAILISFWPDPWRSNKHLQKQLCILVSSVLQTLLCSKHMLRRSKISICGLGSDLSTCEFQETVFLYSASDQKYRLF